MKYWANINGVQHGPVEKDELIGLGLTPDSYVWREGLEDWVMVQNFGELSHLFAAPEAETPAAPEQAELVVPPVPEQPQEPPVVPQQQYAPQQPVMQPQVPCPPTNLVWGILTTVFCCQVLGIVSIVYAMQVSLKYHAGDFEGAQRYSDRAAMWSILAIVVGLVVTPFVVLLQFL